MLQIPNYTPPPTIGGRIKLYRKLRRMTQRELATAAYSDHTAISRYEREYMLPSTATIQNIARALGIPVSDLTEGHERTISVPVDGLIEGEL